MPFVTQKTERNPDKIPRITEVSIPWTRTRNDFTVHVLEHPPAVMRVIFKKKWKDSSRHKRVRLLRYRIRVPWMYFLLKMNRMGAIMDTFLFFTREKITDPKKGTIHIPPMPNIYPSGHICNGTIKVDFEDPPWKKTVEAFRAFWTTPFTEETWPERDSLIPRCFRNGKDGRFYIEYGYLQYIFQYWGEHDRDCPPDCFPWGYLIAKSGSVGTLDQAIQYALDFVPKPRPNAAQAVDIGDLANT